MIRVSTEIDRAPADVFYYIEQLERHGEWQAAIISARKEPPGATRLGTRNIEVRDVPGGPREIVSEVIAYDPPRHIAAQGLNGPIRAKVAITVEPLDGGTRSQVIQDLDLKGHGFGKMLVLLARRSAKRQMAQALRRLKAILEAVPFRDEPGKP